MSDDQALKPCVFCQGTLVSPEHVQTMHNYGTDYFWQVECENLDCEATGPARNTKEQAIQAWNERPREDEQHRILKEAQELLEDTFHDDWCSVNLHNLTNQDCDCKVLDQLQLAQRIRQARGENNE